MTKASHVLLYGTSISLGVAPIGSTKGFNESSWSSLLIDYLRSVPLCRGALCAATADHYACQQQCPELGRYDMDNTLKV